MTSAEQVDRLIDARWIIPVEPDGAVLADHSVAVRAGKIIAVVPTAEASDRFRAERRFALSRHALIPGLVNLHAHAAMTLLRGSTGDLALKRWITERMLPVEAKHLSPQFVHDGTLLACAEMLRGGVTCFNDMYFYPESTASAVTAIGMRATIGIIAMEAPTAYATDPDDYLARGLAARDALGDMRLLSFCLSPVAAHNASDKTLLRVLTMAEELDLPIHLHLHESRGDIEASLAEHKMRPLQRLQALGMAGARLIAAGAVHLSAEELDLLARSGCSIAHCPSSNLRLACGVAPVAQMLARGINVGLGTDAPPGSDRLDLFQEMRAAALLAKAISGDPESMPARQALRSATLNGAQALGLDADIGSISPGKAADLCAVSFDCPELSPCHDPVAQLVYAAGRENVSHVWVAGRLVVEESRLAWPGAAHLHNLAVLWQNKLVE